MSFDVLFDIVGDGRVVDGQGGWGVLRGLGVSKMCQGLLVTRSLLKIGGHWVKVGKNGGLSVKVSKKSRVFLVAHCT